MRSRPDKPEPNREPWAGPFPALRYKDCRIWFAGMLVTTVGMSLAGTSLNWVVLEQTNDPIYLSLLQLARQMPMVLLMLPAGLLADRMSKRRLLTGTNLIVMALTGVMALFSGLDLLPVWLILVFAAGRSGVNSVSGPAQQTIVMDLVEPEDVPAAQGAGFAAGSVGGIVGALASGWLLDRIGLSWCLTIQAASMVGVLTALLLIRPHPAPRRKRNSHPVHETAMGLRLAWSRPDVVTNLVMLSLMAILQQGFRTVLLPVLAKNTFGGDAKLNGYFAAANAVGMFLGASAVAAAVKKHHQGRWMMIGALLGAVSLAALAISPTPAVAMIFIAVGGASWFVFGSPSNSAVQLAGGMRYRSRLLSVHILICTGSSPIGAMLYGWGTKALTGLDRLGPLAGARGVMLFGAVATLLVALTLGVRMVRLDRR